MTPDQFRAWRVARFRSQAAAGAALGLSRETIGNYEAGKRRDGRPVEIPHVVDLACSAIACNLGPWPIKPGA